jgi:hypothetical protein
MPKKLSRENEKQRIKSQLQFLTSEAKQVIEDGIYISDLIASQSTEILVGLFSFLITPVFVYFLLALDQTQFVFISVLLALSSATLSIIIYRWLTGKLGREINREQLNNAAREIHQAKKIARSLTSLHEEYQTISEMDIKLLGESIEIADALRLPSDSKERMMINENYQLALRRSQVQKAKIDNLLFRDFVSSKNDLTNKRLKGDIVDD